MIGCSVKHWPIRNNLVGFISLRRGSGKSANSIGDCSLRVWDGVSCDIGWSVHETFRNRGYATEMGAALRQMAFQTLGLHRVCALCRVGNEASRRVMVKLGMEREGTLREHVQARGVWWSSWLYSSLAG